MPARTAACHLPGILDGIGHLALLLDGEPGDLSSAVGRLMKMIFDNGRDELYARNALNKNNYQ